MKGNGMNGNGKKDNPSLGESYFKAVKSFSKALPMLIGVVLLIGLFNAFITKEMIASVFTGNTLGDTFVGALIGSLTAGNPITSYIIGGELLDEGVSLFAVTSFMVAWVTVGTIQLPAEAAILGKRFAVIRNALSFIFAILVSILTVAIMGVIQ